MTDTINIVGGGNAVAPVGQQLVRVPAASVDGAVGAPRSDAAPQAAALSPRLFDDPLAGALVTEQLDAQGQVVSQNPPGAVLAYLRNGLTIEGYPKQSVTA